MERRETGNEDGVEKKRGSCNVLSKSINLTLVSEGKRKKIKMNSQVFFFKYRIYLSKLKIELKIDVMAILTKEFRVTYSEYHFLLCLLSIMKYLRHLEKYGIQCNRNLNISS